MLVSRIEHSLGHWDLTIETNNKNYWYNKNGAASEEEMSAERLTMKCEIIMKSWAEPASINDVKWSNNISGNGTVQGQACLYMLNHLHLDHRSPKLYMKYSTLQKLFHMQILKFSFPFFAFS